MRNDAEFIQFVMDQIDPSRKARVRAMFGGHTLYSKDKVVGLICENQLFVKPTDAGRSFIGKVVEAPPYEGAKNSFLIRDEIEDGDWLSELIALTESALPRPRPKKKKKR
jgi:TfoX/Sxy family transcriptional regulator of competence genes